MATEVSNVIVIDSANRLPEDSIAAPSPEIPKTSISEIENISPNARSEIEKTVSSDPENKVVQDHHAHDENVISKVRKKKNIFDSDSEEETNPSGPKQSERKEKKTKRLIDSDSDQEETLIGTNPRKDDDVSYETDPKKAERSVDSNSDEEESLIGTNIKNREDISPGIVRKSRFRTIVDSDTDEEGSKDAEPEDKESCDSAERKKSGTKISNIVDSDSKDDSDGTLPIAKGKKKSRKNKTQAGKLEKSKLHGLVDSDSEDEEPKSVDESFNKGNETEGAAKKSGKTPKRTGSARASKDEAMRQIRSETQRLIRTSEVSLPYHRPKQRSLQDFLNRKKFMPALPQGLTTAAKVKMSSEIVGKVLEEKEKEAEIFYKSSDSEDEEKSPVIEDDPRSTSIDNTQKITKNDMQNAHNKKEIIQQGGVDIGVPRKLFIDEPGHRMEEDEEAMEVQDDETAKEDSARVEAPRRSKETKSAMWESSAPRKLFGCDYDEGVDSPPKEADASMIVEKVTPERIEEDEGVYSSKNEGISSSSDNDANDFALRLAASALNAADGGTEEIDASQTEDNVELNISETPFLSNREYARLNEREKSTRKDRRVVEAPRVFGDVIGLPPPEIDCKSTTSSIKKKLLSGLTAVEPKLRGSPGMMIDFSNDSRDKEGVRSLVDRFIRHSAAKKSTISDKNPVTVLLTEKMGDGDVKLVEEILPYKLPVAEAFTEKELQKPGAKYKRLRMDLIRKMAEKRDEEWRLREQRERDENREDEEEEEDDDEVAEKDTADEATTESEPEVDDLPTEKRKKRKSHQFADEEAEVSGEEEDEKEEEEEEEEEDVNEEEDEEDQISLRVDDDNSDPEESSLSSRRIVSGFQDDSEPEAPQRTGSCVSPQERGKQLERTKTDVDIFTAGDDGWSDTEADFPPSQVLPREQADARSQLCKTPLTAINNVLRFVSPITQLTALNSSIETPRRDSPASNEARGSGCYTDSKTPRLGDTEESPILRDIENDRGCGFQKKLFQDPAGSINDEELMGLCSGKFTSHENEERASGKSLVNRLSEKGPEVTESQLLRLCSGSFSSENLLDLDPEDKRVSDGDGDSQDAKRGKERSLRVVSSDDEATDSTPSNLPKRKKVQRLELSDEEDEKLEDDDRWSEESEEEKEDDDDDKYVDYDSEENEVVVVPKKDIKKVAAKFVEAEAELSESEWGSEDEDEKDLDKFELEAGDDEDIDEDQMRDQLGKIHMRRVQDDDQREVRMLQELLFEDGDLHTEGSGRERKFKWKNIDQLGNENENPETRANEENGDPMDEENDLEWRKQRIEREKFIEDKMKQSTDDISEDLAVDSQVFQLGIKALKKVKTNQASQKEIEPVTVKPIASRTVLDLVDSQIITQRKTTLHKAVTRGSFLARGDECLARLAEHIKQSSETTIVTRANPKNFVFAHVSPSTTGGVDEATEDDRKMDESTENTKGKKRKSTAGVTPRSTKKAKVDKSGTTGKKLF